MKYCVSFLAVALIGFMCPLAAAEGPEPTLAPTAAVEKAAATKPEKPAKPAKPAKPVKPGPVILMDFREPGCIPCMGMNWKLRRLGREGQAIEEVDTSDPDNQDKVKEYGIHNCPTFIAVQDGKELGRFVGATSIETLRGLCIPPNPKPAPKPTSKVVGKQAK